MNPDIPLDLLGGRSPADFMRRYWQRQPLLIPQAIPAFKPPLTIAAVKRLARQDDVESRLIWREGKDWHMERGPFSRLPKDSEGDWTLLVQGVDLHSDIAAELMHRFRFIPDARLDDMMVSIATEGGGVGPHFDSYDVFLLQAIGQRRWRIGRQGDLTLQPDLPLKILSRFEPQADYVLDPGDMLYLPPQVAHDGIALGPCMTLSIGFRAPDRATLARGMLEAAADQVMSRAGLPSGPYGEPPLPGPALRGLYRDPGQPATSRPAALPDALVRSALDAVGRVRFDETLASRFLGCWLTEPAQAAVFDAGADTSSWDSAWPTHGSFRLDRRTRMLYRGRQMFINGEAATIRASAAMRRLADARALRCDDPACRRLTPEERECIRQWIEDGWLIHDIAA